MKSEYTEKSPGDELQIESRFLHDQDEKVEKETAEPERLRNRIKGKTRRLESHYA